MARFELKELHKEWAVELLLTVGCLVLFYLVLIKPVLREISHLHEDTRLSQEKLVLCQDVARLGKQLKELESSFFALTDRSLVIARISDLANKNQTDVQGITSRTEPGGVYAGLKLGIDMRCSFFSLLKYLKALEGLMPKVNVREINLTSNRLRDVPGDKKPLLQCHMVLGTFLKQKTGKA